MMINIIKRVTRKLQFSLFPTCQDIELLRWYHDDSNGDKRFLYPLTPESTVIDLGGYDGQWASDLFSRYQSEIHVFEAVPEFSDKISRRFAANSKIKIYPYAVGNSNRSDKMSKNDVASSLYRDVKDTIPVHVRDAASLFELCNISQCGLLKVNIEGGEYEVLPRLLETGLISKIDNLQIQFHNVVPSSLKQMQTIQSYLSKTHELMWQYTWIWESWRRKG